jgi:predicted secreted protein
VSIGRFRWSITASAVVFALATVANVSSVRAQATPIQLTVGDTTTLLLDGNPSTGYVWELEDPKDAAGCVSLSDMRYMKNAPAAGERPVLGAPQKFQVLVTGQKPCTTTLAFKYVRSGTPEPASRREFAIEVLGYAANPAPQEEAPDLAPDPTSDPVTDGKDDLFADPNSE